MPIFITKQNFAEYEWKKQVLVQTRNADDYFLTATKVSRKG